MNFRFICDKIFYYRNLTRYYFYETNPVKKITGYAKMIRKMHGNVKSLWTNTRDSSGISWSEYERYFSGVEYAYAYEIKDAVKFDRFRTLDEFGIDYVPQGFIYVEWCE